jgi:hypothetical protein
MSLDGTLGRFVGRNLIKPSRRGRVSPPNSGLAWVGTRKEKELTQAQDASESPAQMIDAKIAGLNDWRGEILARMRALIREADPDVTEAVKWRKPSNPEGVPVWEHAGIICTGETYKGYVKLTFAKGAALPDPACLFNNGFNGNTMRAIDIREGNVIDEEAFKALVRAAVEVNLSSPPKRAARSRPAH